MCVCRKTSQDPHPRQIAILLTPRMPCSVGHLIVMTNFSLPHRVAAAVVAAANMQQHATTVRQLHDKAKTGKIVK